MKYFWDVVPSNKAALVDRDGNVWDYEGLWERIEEFKTRIIHGPGVMAIFCDGAISQYVAYLAALQLGCPVFLVSNNQDTSSVGVAIKYTYKPSIDILECIRPDLTQVLHPDLAVLLSTSGSTGAAKLVKLSRENISSNAESIVNYLEISACDRAPLSLPFQYSFGMSVVNSHLLAGASLAVIEVSVVDPKFWEFFEAVGCTSFSGVPYSFEMLERSSIIERFPSSLRYIAQAGGKLSEHMVKTWVERCAKQGIKFFVMYGQTEASPRIAYMPPRMALESPSAIGIPVPGGSLSVMDDSGAEVSDGQSGELVYRGPNTMMGYAYVDEDLALPGQTNVLMTGDIARKLSNGAYEIVGRKSRFVKIYGLRIGLDTVESYLLESGIKSVCVAFDDLMCVMFEAQTGNVNSSLDQVADNLSTWLKIPRHSFRIYTCEYLPRRENGKPDITLAKEIMKGRIVADSEIPEDVVSIRTLVVGNLTPDEERVATVWGSICGHLEFHSDHSFYDVGGDSLSAVQIGLAMEAEAFPRQAIRATLEGRSLAEVARLYADPSGLALIVSVSTPSESVLPEATVQSWAINATRGFMVLTVLLSHWGPGLMGRLKIGVLIDPVLSPFYHMGTPGFATIFGLGLGFFMLPRILAGQEKSVALRLRSSSMLVLAGLGLTGFATLGTYPFAGINVTGRSLAEAFYNVLAFYVLALLLALPLLRWLARVRDPLSWALGIGLALWPLGWVWAEILPREPLESFLEWPRLMIVAKYSLFRAGPLAMLGLAVGIWLSRQKDNAAAARGLMVVGGAGMVLVLILAIDVYGPGVLLVRDSPFYATILGWLLSFSFVLFAVGALIALIAAWEGQFSWSRRLVQGLIVLGGLALPIFAFHRIVIPLKDILAGLTGLPGGIALLPPISAFLIAFIYGARRIWRMYFP